MSFISLACIYNKKRQLLLGLRNDSGLWSLPGGSSDPGETPKETALREIREETGLVPNSLEFMMKTVIRGREIYVFKATADGTATGRLDPDCECDEWKWFDVKDGIPADIVGSLHGPPPDANILKEVVGYSSKPSGMDLDMPSVFKSESMAKDLPRVKPHVENFQTLVPKVLADKGYELKIRVDKYPTYLKIHAFVEHSSAGAMELASGIAAEYEFGVAELDAFWNGHELTLLPVNLPSPDHQGLGLPFLLAKALFKYVVSKANGINIIARSQDRSMLTQITFESIAQSEGVAFAAAQGTLSSSEIVATPAPYLKTDDEIGRQLEIPYEAEKTMALKMDGVSEVHLEHALNYGLKQPVWEHPKFGPRILQLYCKSANFSEYWGLCIQHPQVTDEHFAELLPNLVGFPNEVILAEDLAKSPKLGSGNARKLIDLGVAKVMANEVVSEAVGDFFTQWANDPSVEAPSPVVSLAAAFTQNPAATPLFIAESLKAGLPKYQYEVMLNSPILPFEWASDLFLQGQVQIGNPALRLAVLNHPKTPIQLILKALADKTPEVANAARQKAMVMSDLNKSHGDPVDSLGAQIGFNGTIQTWLEAAKVLAGGKSISPEQIRQAWIEAEGDMVVAALLAYALPINSNNIAALSGIQQMVYPPPPDIKPAFEPISIYKSFMGEVVVKPMFSNPESIRIANAVQTASSTGRVKNLDVGEENYRGIKTAETSLGEFLIKPASFVQEAVFYDVADAMGMADFLPTTIAVTLDDKPAVVVQLLPSKFQSAGKIAADQPTWVNFVFENRLLKFYLATLDYVLGNPYRHSGNILIDDAKEVRLVNNEVEPGHFVPNKGFFPYYLRCSFSGPVSDLALDQKMRMIGSLNPTDRITFKNWITGLDENKIQDTVQKYGIDPKFIVERLLRLKMNSYTSPPDSVVASAWSTNG